MAGVREVLAGLVLVAPFGVGLSLAGADDGSVAFRFQDRRINESSGLVIEGDLAHTANDSGDSGRIFTVDVRTGETVGVTDWADDPTDVEALAPAGPGEVWVADIGDNGASRDDIEVTRVPVGPGERRVDPETYQLTYPGGRSYDAETLLVHPVTGRLYVVTKQVFNAAIFAAPELLSPDAPNPLAPVGTGPGIATDGAFFPDGDRVIIRSYGSAVVYAWPSLRRLDDLDLPDQRQGEGLAVGPDGRVWLSSEGIGSKVLRLSVPEATVMPSPSAPAGPDPVQPAADVAVEPDIWPWLTGGAVLAVAGVVLLRSLRPR